MKKTNNFRPTFTTLGDRMMPAVGLLAAPGVEVAAIVKTTDHDATGTDAIFVGDQKATVKGVIAADNQNVNTHDAISADSQKASVNEVIAINTAVDTHAVWVGDATTAAPPTSVDPLLPMRTTRVSEKDLRAGDIMLTTVHNATSGIIAIATGSIYTHAALYIGNGRVIEALGNNWQTVNGKEVNLGGVREISLKDYLKENGAAMVIRAKGLNQSDMDRLAKFAESKVGKSYDMAGAIASARSDMSKLWSGNPNRDSYYCSNLVTSAFKSIGKDLFHSLEQTPGDLAHRAGDITGNLFRSVKMEVAGRLS